VIQKKNHRLNFFSFDNKIVGNVNKHDTGYQNQTITEYLLCIQHYVSLHIDMNH